MNFFIFRKAIRRLPGIVIRAVPIPSPKIVEGFGSRENVGKICQDNGYRSVLLVTDKTIYSIGFQNTIVESLKNEGIKVSVFNNISSEPTTDIIYEGRKSAIENKADCIIALGGGSVLDSSKVIAASAKFPKRPLSSFIRKFVFVKTLPMICIPSTSGTGAEITVGAVVKNSKGVKKSTVIVGLNITDVALDSELTLNAPPKVTICCGIDALSHGLEGCLADVKSTDEDIEKSRECVKIIIKILPELISNPTDIENRQKLCLAANYGGNAINKQLAGYVHAFAHTIGSFYHIGHGEAIAYCLLPIIDCFRDNCEDKLYQLSDYCGFSDDNLEKNEVISLFLENLRNLLKKCGFTGGCSQINEKDYPLLVRGIDFDSINYSPARILSDAEIISLLEKIKRGTK